jgi:hypothetical protein
MGAPAINACQLHFRDPGLLLDFHSLSVALLPRTRPSVPKSNVRIAIPETSMTVRPTVHGNASYDALAEMLLWSVSMPKQQGRRCRSWRTATSRTSLLPPFCVSRALRMGGSFSVSNLTVSIASATDARAARRVQFCCGGWCGWGTDHRRRHLNFSELRG